jgi:hypothetical protein
MDITSLLEEIKELQYKLDISENRLKRQQEKYPEILHNIRRIAKGLGYAIGLHGSEARDLDLMAIPWVEEACSPIKLVKEIEKGIGGRINGPVGIKPNGRLAWSILIAGSYVDLSIISPFHSNKLDIICKHCDGLCFKDDPCEYCNNIGYFTLEDITKCPVCQEKFDFSKDLFWTCQKCDYELTLGVILDRIRLEKENREKAEEAYKIVNESHFELEQAILGRLTKCGLDYRKLERVRLSDVLKTINEPNWLCPACMQEWKEYIGE